MNKGKLFMIPSSLSNYDNNSLSNVPSSVMDTILSLRYFIVENIKTTRKYLKQLNKDFDIDNSVFYTLNKHTKTTDLIHFIQPCKNGKNIGLLSEAGCPGIADPGNQIALLAHNENIEVIPLIGPSSIFMALMASGLNGQQFTFYGYLPKNQKERIIKLKAIAQKVKKEGSQIFMETPFRNNHLLEDILKHCPQYLLLCIASEITNPKENIKTMSINKWKLNKPDLNKKPTIFIFGTN